MAKSPSVKNVQAVLRSYASKEKAKILQGFFKTGKGEYGEGDQFLGIVVPNIRKTVKDFQTLPESETIKLIMSPWHEDRLCGLLILVHQFKKGTEKEREHIYKTYLSLTKYINNWDLVDLSAPNIVGTYLVDKPRTILTRLAKSPHLWERRIAIVSTHTFIRKHDIRNTFRIADILIKDKHDLIHKATGWMLREVGKRDEKTLLTFLEMRHTYMPRTMLRYAIERLPEKKRISFLKPRSASSRIRTKPSQK